MSILLDVNVITISASISACEKGSQWPMALQLLAASMEKNVISYSAAMSACAKGMQWQHASWSMCLRRQLGPISHGKII